MQLKQLLDADIYERLLEDPSLFPALFDKQPWPFQQRIMRDCLARGKDGKYKQRISVISLPRQNGKSLLNCWIAMYRLFTDESCEQVLSLGLDREGSRLLMRDAQRIIQNSEMLYELVGADGLLQNEIRLKSGQSWIIRSSDSVRVRGLRLHHVCCDEWGWLAKPDLYESLLSTQSAIPNPKLVLTSTVGPTRSGVLWDLFQGYERGDPDIHLEYIVENLSPKISEKFLEGQRSKLPAFVYAREHSNLWSESSEAFCTIEWFDRATEIDPTLPGSKETTFCYIDLGWLKDETAISIGLMDDKGIKNVVWLEGHSGTRSDPLDFVWLQERIRDLADRFNIGLVRIESPQAVGLSQRLELGGIRSDLIYPSAKSNSRHYGELYTLLKTGGIRIPKDETLRNQLLSSTIAETHLGWKLQDNPRFHNDRLVSIAGLAYMLGDAPRNENIGEFGVYGKSVRQLNQEPGYHGSGRWNQNNPRGTTSPWGNERKSRWKP